MQGSAQQAMLTSYKKPQGVYLEKRQICFFSTKIVDHDDLKDSNFEDDQQPEIAIRPSKPEVFISPKVDRYHQNSNDKPLFATLL